MRAGFLYNEEQFDNHDPFATKIILNTPKCPKCNETMKPTWYSAELVQGKNNGNASMICKCDKCEIRERYHCTFKEDIKQVTVDVVSNIFEIGEKCE